MSTKLKAFVAAVLFAVAASGCSYVNVATKGDKAVVTKNNMFMFGMLNAVYVCDVTDNGLSNCVEGESP